MTVEAYWKTNLRYLFVLLSIWFLISFGCSVLFVDVLDTVTVGSFRLGFWMSQQGSIYGFVLLIFVYVGLMNRLDKKLESTESPNSGAST